jgi:hypothetical protein
MADDVSMVLQVLQPTKGNAVREGLSAKIL